MPPLQETLYDEIVGRIKQDDASVPYRDRGYWYYTRFETGKDYPIHRPPQGQRWTRRRKILLDQNRWRAGKGFFQVGDAEVSQDNQLLAWAEDSVGRRQYVLQVKDLATGEGYSTTSCPTSRPNLVWADDNRTVFYIEKDPVTLLTKRVKAHVLGTPASARHAGLRGKDDSFYMGICAHPFGQVHLHQPATARSASEVRCTPAADPGEFTVIAPRAARLRIPGRSSRRPLGDPHQLGGARTSG